MTAALVTLNACGGDVNIPAQSPPSAPAQPAAIPAAIVENDQNNKPAPNTRSGSNIQPNLAAKFPEPAHPRPDASLTPAMEFGSELHIGAIPPPGPLSQIQNAHGEATVRYGRMNDGIGKSELAEYFKNPAEIPLDQFDRSIGTFSISPVVRIVNGATQNQIDDVVLAIQILNANLPGNFQILIDSDFMPEHENRELIRRCISFRCTPGSVSVWKQNQIVVSFIDQWPEAFGAGARTLGIAYSWTSWTSGEQHHGPSYVVIKESGDRIRLNIILHELLHTFGRKHPADKFKSRTVMNMYVNKVVPYGLKPLDREALLAAYTVLFPGAGASDIVTALDSWERESLHVHGEINDDLTFGAALRNGLVRPWARGPKPGDVALADNPQLSGTATWNGRILGLTPSGNTVAGATGFEVDLQNLRGDLDFTDMEQWTGAPGAVGSGDIWGDGDLGYDIAVQGNTFSRVGGDSGIISGSFFGTDHQGMGGTLVRDDLSAGFAGQR